MSEKESIISQLEQLSEKTLSKHCTFNKSNSLNRFYQNENYWIMVIKVKNTVNEKYFNSDHIQVLFDGNEESVKRILNTTWHIGKHKGGKFYVQTGSYNKEGVKTFLHQIVVGQTTKGQVVDHVNGNTFDNRKENLRNVTQKINSQNRKNTGVPSRNGMMWYYMISINGYQIHTPVRTTYDEADIDSLIVQKHFNFKHRECEFYKLDRVDSFYEQNLIKIMEKKLENKKTKTSKFKINEYEPSYLDGEEVLKVYDSKKRYCYISKDDIWLLKLGRFTFRQDGYWQIKINNCQYRLHRYILGINKTNIHNIQVDHINGNPNDNRRSNLVITTDKGNKSNKKSVGYGFYDSKYQVNSSNYWEYIQNHRQINSKRIPYFEEEIQAKEEVYKRKYLCDVIRPKFRDFQEYILFNKECKNKDLDTYWINKCFPNINNITIPKYSI